MNEQPVIRDERTIAVADTSHRFAYIVLAFGVLIAATVRGLAFHQACWDLLGLVVVSSAVGVAYQRVKHVEVLPRRGLIWLALLSAVVAAAIAIALALLRP